MTPDLSMFHMADIGVKLKAKGVYAVNVSTIVSMLTLEAYIEVVLLNGHKARVNMNDPFDTLLAACLMVHDLPNLENGKNT